MNRRKTHDRWNSFEEKKLPQFPAQGQFKRKGNREANWKCTNLYFREWVCHKSSKPPCSFKIEGLCDSAIVTISGSKESLKLAGKLTFFEVIDIDSSAVIWNKI